MSQLAPQSLGSLPATLNTMAQIFAPKSITLVGAGNGSGTVVQWLLTQNLAQVQLLEADQSSFTQLNKRVDQNSGRQLRHELIVPGLATPDPLIFYQYALSSESGLLAPDHLKAIWPNLQLRNQQPAQGITLAGLTPSDWLLLDCLPAAQLLQCAPLKDTQVVLARVTLDSAENTCPGSGLAEVQDLLSTVGLKLLALFQERNTGLGKALFGRNPAALRSEISNLTEAKEAEAKGRAAEAAARQAEAQAKVQALAKLQALESENSEIGKTKDQALEKLRTECDALNQEILSLKSELKKNHILFECQCTMGTAKKSALWFNTKSEGVYKNKKGHVRFDLSANTPAYLVSNEIGDFEVSPQENQIPLEANKAYEISGAVTYEGVTPPVIWLFEYDQNKKKIHSHTFATNNGEFRALFKTHCTSTAYAVGIRLSGTGSIDPKKTELNFENTLAIEVAEALQKDAGALEKKLADVQASLQKQQQTQSHSSLRQIESFLMLQNYCGDRILLPDMHGWPVSPDLAVHLIRLVETGGYDAVVEFGSGASTLFMALSIQKNTSQNTERPIPFVSFEHLENYLQATEQHLQQAQLSDYAKLVYAPLVDTVGAHNTTVPYYNCAPALRELGQALSQQNPKLLVFVDGPPAATGPLARYPAMAAIEAAFGGTVEVHYLMDDYIRQDERDIVDMWQAALEQQGRSVQKQEFKQFEKQACLLITKAAET